MRKVILLLLVANCCNAQFERQPQKSIVELPKYGKEIKLNLPKEVTAGTKLKAAGVTFLGSLVAGGVMAYISSKVGDAKTSSERKTLNIAMIGCGVVSGGLLIATGENLYEAGELIDKK